MGWQFQAGDDREADLRRSLRDAESKHKQQIAHLDASILGLQRYQLLHTQLQYSTNPSQQHLPYLELIWTA